MSKLIYGIDPTKEVTIKNVRDATVKCFVKAHKDVLAEMEASDYMEDKKEVERMKKMSIKLLVRNFFEEVGGDYNHPTKVDMEKVLERLAEFAKNFRNPELVTKHYAQINELMKVAK